MDSSRDLYCASCGAVNTVDAETCFACRKPLQSVLAENETITEEIATTSTRQFAHDHLLKQRYRTLKEIGKGGFGAVYKAEDIQLGNRLVAIKEVSQHSLSSQELSEAITAFKHEALLLAGLTHPNLPRIYEHFAEAGHWYLVMDFIEGESLEARLQKVSGGRLSIKEALNIAIQLCTVLNYLHTRQPPIIFRDLKPANIILTPEGHPFLIDFGIARHFKPGQLKDTVAFGSPGYAAPEQYGKRQTTPRADIYSLGAILHQMLTGNDPSETPFHFAVPLVLVPPRLSALIMQMLEMDVDKRPESVAVVKQRLQQISAGRETIEQDLIASRALHPLPPALSSTVPTSLTATVTRSPKAAKQVMYPSAPHPPSSSSSAIKTGRRMVAITIIGMLALFACVVSNTHHSHQYNYAPPQNNYSSTSGYQGTPVDLTATVSSLSLGDRLIDINVGSSIGPVLWSPDGQYIAYATPDAQGDVVVHNIGTNQDTIVYTGENNNKVIAIEWLPDSTRLLGVSTDQQVYIWNITQPNTTAAISTYTGQASRVQTVVVSPDGQHIASISDDGTVYVWNAITGTDVVAYGGHSQGVQALAWSPDGNHIASASDNTVRVWDASTGKTIFVYRGHSGTVKALAWSPDGKLIASGSNDKTVQVWDATTGQHIFTYRGHTDSVLSLAWSPDGQSIASGSSDKTVQIWSVVQTASTAAGKLVYTYKGLSAPVLGVTWSPDETFIASTGEDDSLQVWRAK